MNKSFLKSRKFWYTIGTLAANVAVCFVPVLLPVREELIGAITLLGLTLVGAHTYTDGKALAAGK